MKGKATPRPPLDGHTEAGQEDASEQSAEAPLSVALKHSSSSLTAALAAAILARRKGKRDEIRALAMSRVE